MTRLFENLSIGIKAFTASALLVLGMAALGAQALVFLSALKADLTLLSESSLAKQRQVLEIAQRAIDTHVNVFRYVAWASTGVNRATLNTLSEQVRRDGASVAARLAFLATRSDLTERERVSVNDATVKWRRYAIAASDTIEISATDPALGTVMLGGTDDDYSKVSADLQAIAAMVTTQTQTSARKLLSQASGNQHLIAWGGACAVLLAGFITMLVVRSIVKPIERVTEAMRAVSIGDSHGPLPMTDRSDEVGQMWRAILIFREKLESDNRLLSAREKELTTQNIRFDAALNNMSQGLVMFDKDDRVIVANQQYIDMYCLPADFVTPGRTLRELLEARAQAGTFGGDIDRYLARRIPAGTVERKTTEIPDGRIVTIVNRGMMAGGWVSTHQDVTEQHGIEQRIAYMARHDSLTGLPNRIQFRECMELALDHVRQGGKLAVLSIDLDCFKEINDTLGHPVGDELLNAVARRLSSCMHEGAIVARLGGDEFAVLSTGEDNPQEAAVTTAKKLLAAVASPYDLDEHHLLIGTSIGIALSPEHGTDVDQLMKSADLALYKAKAGGRNTYCVFESTMGVAAQTRRELETDLRNALTTDDFELYYQPIVDLMTKETASVEALIRWRSPERGVIGPDEFISLCEETGLIHQLGQWALRRACRDAVGWPQHINVSVNLSPVQFRTVDPIGIFSKALAESGLPAKRLELEITESVLMQGNAANIETLHQLRALGISIVLDDFGTGYSSLSYLRMFPFNKIKIDRSFVAELSRNADCASIVSAIAGLGRSLNVATVAEGVETDEQLVLVRSAGCTHAQGFLFGRPCPVTELAFMRSQPHKQKDEAA